MSTPNEKIRELVYPALGRGPDFTVVDRWLHDRPNATVIDIGTNEGGFVSKWISLGASRVHAFEPVPAVFERLKQNFGKNPLVQINKLAVSENSMIVKDVQILNAHTLAKPRDTGLAIAKEDTGAFDIETTTLDKYVMDKAHLGVDFIKLDVDGYEAKALRGMTWTLERFRPAVMIELSFLPYYLGDNCEAMVRHIYAMAYKLVTMSGEVCDDPILVMEAYPWRTSLDMVMMPNEKIPNNWPRLR